MIYDARDRDKDQVMKHQNECCTKELTFYLESNEKPLKGFCFFFFLTIECLDQIFIFKDPSGYTVEEIINEQG